MAVPQALVEAIRNVAPGADIQVGPVNNRFAGIVVAEEFEPLTHLERQSIIWKSIRQRMGIEAQTVGTLLLYSPEEAEAVQEDED